MNVMELFIQFYSNEQTPLMAEHVSAWKEYVYGFLTFAIQMPHFFF